MGQLSFDEITAAIAAPCHKPLGDKLKIAPPPEPFVAPVFDRQEAKTEPLREVVLIRASAAVGKSTIAKAISAARGVAILDLAVTAVATGSLKGLLGDLRNDSHPLDSFHNGMLPIIIDALDEGRLRSGENGFVSFLETSAETILESRQVKNKPKLILLGRPDAVEIAEAYFSDAGIDCSVIDVGYFDQRGAIELIHAYAKESAGADSLYFVHTEPVERLITTYFDKIEAALGLPPGELWLKDSGRSFAGYAPVLAAIGSLLPEIENFQEAQNRLNDAGTQDAWGVIESVLDQIIEREKGKLIPHVKSDVLPDLAYDREEQLTLLLQFVQGEALKGTGRLQLPASEMLKYDEQVKRWLPEHPFLRNGYFTNDVIASFVFAPAIANIQVIRRLDRLVTLSRQPFLWRSLAKLLTCDTLLDGRHLGLLLNSFWNDPLTQSHLMTVKEGDGRTSAVAIRSGDELIEFQVASPITLLGLLKNAEVNVTEGLSFEGVGGDALAKVFVLEDSVVTSASAITLDAAKLHIVGNVRLDSDVAPTGGQLSIELAKGSCHGWGAVIKNKYPFSQHPSTLEETFDCDGSKLHRLLQECGRRFHSGAALALNSDYTAPENDPYTQWANRQYPEEFPKLMSLLVKHGFAETEAMHARGNVGKIRMRLNESMTSIANGILLGQPRYADLAQEVRLRMEE